MRSFVTGGDGFVGQWLIRHLLDLGDDVVATARDVQPALTTLDAQAAKAVEWRPLDLTDPDGAQRALRGVRTDAVYHLAAQSSVPRSLERPLETFEVNTLGTIILLEACVAHAPDASIVVAGSADAYGIVAAEEVPISEERALRPVNPYAASKAAAEAAAFAYARTGKLRVLCTRSFNHTGPGQSTRFAPSAFAKQIAGVSRGAAPPRLRVGNLWPTRDLSDVRDIVAAYGLLARRGKSGVAYNVCSGVGTTMRQVVDALLAIAGTHAELVEDPQLVRAVDSPTIVGDASRLRADTGWQPQRSLHEALSDLYAWHLAQDAA